MTQTCKEAQRCVAGRKSEQKFALVCFLAVTLLCAAPATNIQANLLGDIVNKIGRAVNPVTEGIGGIIGAPFGGFIKSALDPALDGAVARFRQVADQAADRIDTTLQNENLAVDAIAKQNIERVDAVMGRRIDQVDQLIDEKIQRVSNVADSLLNREAVILDSALTRGATMVDSALTRESGIVNSALTRVEGITDKTLNRVQDIENDAFSRIDAALEDQVPIAASRVAKVFVVAAVAIAFVVVLAGVIGFQALKQFRAVQGDGWRQSTATALRQLWRVLPRELIAVSVPMVFVSVIVLACYAGYLQVSKQVRINRLEIAARLLEQSGSYQVAAELRRRLIIVAEDAADKKRNTEYQRDLWLRDFTSSYSLAQTDLLKRLALTFENPPAEIAPKTLEFADADLWAASIYLNARFADTATPKDSAQYRERFIDGKSSKEVPSLGKLVLVALIRQELDRAAPVRERLEKAKEIARQLTKLYPRYVNAHVVLAKLMAFEADAKQHNAKSTKDQKVDAQTMSEIQQALSVADALDPDIARLVRLTNLQLPADIVRDLDQHSTQADLKNRLADFSKTTILPLAQSIFASEALAKTVVDKVLVRAIRKDVGERRLDSMMDRYRHASDKKAKLQLAMQIAENAIWIGSFSVAENWILAAREELAAGAASSHELDIRLKELEGSVLRAKLSIELSEVM